MNLVYKDKRMHQVFYNRAESPFGGGGWGTKILDSKLFS